MRSFQKKGKLQRIMQSKIFLIFLGLLMVVFIYSLFGFVNKMLETVKNKKNLEDKISELEKSKEKLTTDIQKLNTDQGVEENIRDKFGLAKEGENMIMIVDDKDSPKQEDTAQKPGGFLSFLKNWFK